MHTSMYTLVIITYTFNSRILIQSNIAKNIIHVCALLHTQTLSLTSVLCVDANVCLVRLLDVFQQRSRHGDVRVADEVDPSLVAHNVADIVPSKVVQVDTCIAYVSFACECTRAGSERCVYTMSCEWSETLGYSMWLYKISV